MDDYADRLLTLVLSPGYTPLKLKALARRLEIADEERPQLRAAVRDLVRAGKVDVGRDKTIRLPDRRGLIPGTFRRSSRGFGFVKPDEANAGRGSIFIPLKGARDAATGDRVLVKLVRRGRRPGESDEGRVVRVESRGAGSFVGVYRERGGTGYVTVDGGLFRDPIPVGDPGAKGVKPEDKVVIELARYPTHEREGEGVIVEILGPRGAPGVDTLSVIRAFNLPDRFSDEALAEAREQARLFDEEQLDGRLDLRLTPTITIDPATARDFDDAISLDRDHNGYYNLAVHIADVSHFVPAGSPLDREARERGTSVYLPDVVIPMLPELISNNLASLQADRTRFTVSVFMEFNCDGVLTSRRFGRSAIKVDRRFSYEQVMEFFAHPETPPADLSAEIIGMLTLMRGLAARLRARRFTRGSLELTLPEVEIDLESGRVAGAHLAIQDESHQLIEEFMLAANEAVAAELHERQIAFIRRSHPDPDPFKLDDFAEFVRGLGLKLDLPQSRFELQRILSETKGQPEEYAVHFALLRSLKQARYTTEPEGHYALASDTYCHFTSPIRRYPDLTVHRQLVALLAGETPRLKLDQAAALAEHCTKTERRAQAAERDLVRIKLLTHLLDHVGDSFHAVVVGVEEFGLFCRLIELPVEGLVHITTLTEDYYYLEPGTHTLVGRRGGSRRRLGDRLIVRVARVDVDRRQLDLVLDEPAPQASRPGTIRKPATTESRPHPRLARPAHPKSRGPFKALPHPKKKKRRHR